MHTETLVMTENGAC